MLDRKALPTREVAEYGVHAYAAPQGEVETLLAAMWQELLGHARVGRHDNFFELGGHSLLALQLMARLRHTLGRELALRQLFDHPTIAALAAQLASTGISADRAIAPREHGDAPLALSFAQQRLWFLSQLEGASAAYHMTLPLRLYGALDVPSMQAALDTLLERHESLRTVFRSVDDAPVQLVLPQARCKIEEIDLCAWPAAEREAEMARQSEQASLAPFDLGSGPLMRVRLLRAGEDEHVLIVVVHHIVSDGWSIGVLLRELAALYGAYRQGQPNPLPALPLQYADYALWQRSWLQGAVLERQAGFWKQLLAGAPALLELPADHARPPVQSYRGGSVDFSLGAELSNKLRALARRHDATLFMTVFAGLALLLARLAGQDQVVIGTPVANRNRTELEGMIGLFVNTLALPARLDESMSVGALLDQVKETTLSAYGHQDLPFEQLVELLQPVRSLASSPVFQVMLVLDNTPHSDQGLPGLRVAPQAMAGQTEQFDLSLSLHETGEQVAGVLSYASDLFEHTTAARWAGHWRTILAAMAEDGTQPLSAISLLDAGERAAISEGFNAGFDPAAAAPPHGFAHHWFETQARLRPAAPAIVHEAGELCYRELNERANRLARDLHARGIGAEQVVGICGASGPDVLVAVLGVLKAGAAYLPLDPSYPRERLAYMVGDARPALVPKETDVAEAVGRAANDASGQAAEPENRPTAASASST